MDHSCESWDNLIAYPDFEIPLMDDRSLFWRIESPHPFFTVGKGDGGFVSALTPGPGLRINNYYHEPVVIRNGFWGSRIFLERDKKYTMGMRYRSSVRFYLGLYHEDSQIPVKFWVLEPSEGEKKWKDEFLWHIGLFPDQKSSTYPLHLKIIVPDTCGGFVDLKGLYLINCSCVMDDLPVVALGIVTFNRRTYLKSLLGQVAEINYPKAKIHIFVVDNASTDGTHEMLVNDFPEVTVLKNRENLGGSGGFNRFFRHLATMDDPPECGWLVDDDASIDRNTLLNLARTLVRDKSVAVAGSVMMDLEKPAMVYEAGGDLFKDRFGWRANLINADAGELGHVKERGWEVGYAGAYSLLFRTEVIKKVGIWRDYFLHVDDSEWCLRIQKKIGKKVVIVLDSLIWHVLQGAKKPFTSLRYYETRNFLDFFAGTGDKKALLKVMGQTLLMGLKQLFIKRRDLFGYHIKGVEDFIEGRFGKQELQRTAWVLPDIQSVLEAYKDRKGSYPAKFFLVKEINAYLNDGKDHEGEIIEVVRRLSPSTSIIEASVHGMESALRRGDGFQCFNPPKFKIFLLFNMVKSFFFPSRGIVVLPFWNESIVPNNFASLTAVVEDGRFSLYGVERIRSTGLLIRTLFKAIGWWVKVMRGRIDINASHLPVEPPSVGAAGVDNT